MSDKHFTGEPCPTGCGGQLRVRSSRRTSDGQWCEKYFECPQCGEKAKSVVPASHVLRRRLPIRALVNPA